MWILCVFFLNSGSFIEVATLSWRRHRWIAVERWRMHIFLRFLMVSFQNNREQKFYLKVFYHVVYTPFSMALCVSVCVLYFCYSFHVIKDTSLAKHEKSVDETKLFKVRYNSNNRYIFMAGEARTYTHTQNVCTYFKLHQYRNHKCRGSAIKRNNTSIFIIEHLQQCI